MKILVILNHQPTSEQLAELSKLGYDEVEIVKHPPIPPEAELSEVGKIFDSIVESREFDALWVQGDFRFFACAVLEAHARGFPLFVATTRREAREEVQPDGSIKKVSVFKHVRFVRV